MVLDELKRNKIALEEIINAENNSNKTHKVNNAAIWQSLLDDVIINIADTEKSDASLASHSNHQHHI